MKRKKRPGPGRRRRKQLGQRQRALLLGIVERFLVAAWGLHTEVRWHVIRSPETELLRRKAREEGLADALAARARALEHLDQAAELISAGRCSSEDVAQIVLDRTAHEMMRDGRRAVTEQALQFLNTVLNDQAARQVIAACDPTGSLTNMVGPILPDQERPANLGTREDLIQVILAHLGTKAN